MNKNNNFVGVYSVCNTLSIGIYDILDNGYICWGWSNDNVKHYSKIRYKENKNNNIDVLFRVGHTWVNLRDFIKIDY